MADNYDVLAAGMLSDLIQAVEEKMRQGWKPLGGVVVDTWSQSAGPARAKGYYTVTSSQRYLQAIVKAT